MNDLRTAAQQALEALELAQTDVHWELNSPTRKVLRKAEKALRAALAEDALDRMAENARELGLDYEPVQEPDLSRCPKCGGPADNGHDRCIPPNPYHCTKCMAELEPYDQTSLELCPTCGWKTLIPGDGCLNCERQNATRPQWPALWVGCPNCASLEAQNTELDAKLAELERKPLTDEKILNMIADGLQFGTFFDVARAIEQAHGIKP